MVDNGYLFSEKWKNIISIIIIIASTFLDKIIPPFGIPVAIICVFILFRIRKLHLKYLGLFKPESWIKTIAIGLIVGLLISAFGIYVLSPIREFFGIAQENPDVYKTTRITPAGAQEHPFRLTGILHTFSIHNDRKPGHQIY